MKRVLWSIFLGAVLPWWVARLTVLFMVPQVAVPHPTQSATGQTVAVLRQGAVTQMALEDYLAGVLLCEMPASFSSAAKQAQAVAARTYTLKTVARDKHPGGAVCTDAGCCQGYREPDGSAGAVAAAQAVEATRGLVLTYGGDLIEATYYASSGGRTEAAVAVWGSDIPYLQAVESPEPVEVSAQEVCFTGEEFLQALGLKLTGKPEDWLGAVTNTAGGGVAEMVIGGKVFTGTELRSRLGLRSTAFEIRVEGQLLWISTVGYGHRVGMSQYGAETMALAGADFRQILSHYYPGTTVTNWGG